MMVMAVEMMMIIPMKSSVRVMTMAMISPLWEGISLADFSLPESFFSLCCFRPRGGVGIFPRWLPQS